MKKLPLVLWVASTLWAVFPRSADAVLEFQGNFWLMTPDGEASVGMDGLVGTSIDLERDLGYDDAENIWGARLTTGFEHHQFEVDYINLDLSADNRIERDIRFGDEVFSVREDVSSGLDTKVIQGYYRFVAGSENVRGGFKVGGIYLGIEAELSSDSVGSESEEVDTGAPMVGLFIEGEPVGFLELKASISGSSWDFGDVEATFFDFEATAQVEVGPVFAGGGYRNITIDAEDENNFAEVDLTLSGPMFYAGFEW